MANQPVIQVLEREDIIPEIIPTIFLSSMEFSIVWPNGKAAALGNFLTREDTLEEPDLHFIFPGEDSSQEVSYTLVMTDPDAPSRADPKYRQFRHWVITGIKAPVTESKVALKMKLSTTPYRPPGPPPGSGIHRYTFLLFEEPESGFTVPEGAPEYGAALEERRSWNAVDFGNKHGLKLVGANLFLVQAAESQ